MAMHGRMPVVAAAESRRQFPRRRNVSVAVQHVADLVRIFLVHARQRELCESFRRFRVESAGGCRRGIFSSQPDDWHERQNTENIFHPQTVHNFISSTSPERVNFTSTLCEVEDRKSTRLNSSHVAISYA